MWDYFTYSFPNFDVATVEVWEWIKNFIYTSLGILEDKGPIVIQQHEPSHFYTNDGVLSFASLC